MKENTRESEKSKEAAERAARKARRDERKRRETARQLSGGKKGSTVVARGVKSAGSDKPSRIVPIEIPATEKRTERKRLKTIITQDNILKVSYDPHESKVALCNEHHDRLYEKMKLHGLTHLITRNEDELKQRLMMKGGIDPMYHSGQALIRLAIDTIGSEGVVQHHCPVCALKNFDFLSQIAYVMREACKPKP